MALHWTQTKKGKIKMSKAQKKRWAKVKKTKVPIKKTKSGVKRNEPASQEVQQSTQEIAKVIEFENTHTFENAVAIGYATFTTWISLYSEFTGVSESALTKRLAETLLSKSRR